jgi:hypothetical protein
VITLDGEVYRVKRRLVPSLLPYPSLRRKVQGKIDERLTPKPGRSHFVGQRIRTPESWQRDAFAITYLHPASQAVLFLERGNVSSI